MSINAALTTRLLESVISTSIGFLAFSDSRRKSRIPEEVVVAAQKRSGRVNDASMATGINRS